MPKDVRVKLSGEETVSQAAQSATGALTGLQNAALSLAGIASVTQLWEQFRSKLEEVKKFVDECTQAWVEEEKGILSLEAALQTATNTTIASSKSLQDFATNIGLMSGNTTKSVVSLETLLVTSGRTEEQIKALITAAVGLSAATGKDLNTSVAQLNATYDGHAGRLIQLFPAIGNLTKAQLEAGDAIAIVQSHVEGQNAALEHSTDVSLKNYKNAWEELHASMGQSIATTLTPVRNAITDIVNEWAKAIKGANDYRDAQNRIKGGEDPLKKLQDQILVVQENIKRTEEDRQSSLQMGNLTSFASYQANTPENPTMTGYKQALQAVNAGFDKTVAGLNKQLSALELVMTDATKAQLDQKKKDADAAGAPARAAAADAEAAKLAAFIEQFAVKSDKSNKDAIAAFAVQEQEALAKAAKEFAGHPGDEDIATRAIRDYFTLAINNEITKEAKEEELAKKKADSEAARALVAQQRLYDEQMRAMAEQTQYFKGIEKDVADAAKDYWKEAATGAYGAGPAAQAALGQTQVGQMAGIGGAAAIDPMTMIIQVVMQFMSQIKGLTQILNPLTTILQGVFDVIAPLISTIIQPLVGILTILGNTLGKILVPIIETLLVPVITLVSQVFIALYNFAIIPLADGLIVVLNLIYDAAAGFYNALSAVVRTLTFGLVNIGSMSYRSWNEGFLSKISMSDLNAAGAAATGATSGSTATVQTQRPINNYFTLNTDVMVGPLGGFDQFVNLMTQRQQQLGLLKM